MPSKLEAALWVVATPIGNLGDITERARNVLAAVDVIAVEDTRVTGGLLHKLGIKARMTVYNDHSDARDRDRLVARIAAGESVALVSDAGTPMISDPGIKLVRAVRDAGHPVRPVPGASSLMAALMVAGLPTDRFLFAGFMPGRDKARRDELESLGDVRASLVFLETAPRLQATLTAAAEILGARETVIARELTKLHEELLRGTPQQLLERLEAAPPLKGEIVLLFGPPADKPDLAIDPAAIDAALREALVGNKPRAAAQSVARRFNLDSKRLYARIVELKTHG